MLVPADTNSGLPKSDPRSRGSWPSSAYSDGVRSVENATADRSTALVVFIDDGRCTISGIRITSGKMK